MVGANVTTAKAYNSFDKSCKQIVVLEKGERREEYPLAFALDLGRAVVDYDCPLCSGLHEAPAEEGLLYAECNQGKVWLHIADPYDEDDLPQFCFKLEAVSVVHRAHTRLDRWRAKGFDPCGTFDMNLLSCGEPAKVIEVLTSTGLGLLRAQGLVGSTPTILKECLQLAEALKLQEQLTAVGAKVEIVPTHHP